jgi:hypothetical protein
VRECWFCPRSLRTFPHISTAISNQSLLSLAVTLADRRINNLQQDVQSMIWYDSWDAM